MRDGASPGLEVEDVAAAAAAAAAAADVDDDGAAAAKGNVESYSAICWLASVTSWGDKATTKEPARAVPGETGKSGVLKSDCPVEAAAVL
jgi:hypothetical protein